MSLETRLSALATRVAAEVKSLRTALTGKVDYGDALMPTNTFGGKSLYINTIHNALFRAETRWSVTGEFRNATTNAVVGSIPAWTLASLFNGDYESGMNIPAGQKAVVRINFPNYFPGYPYGYIYFSHYYTQHTASISVRGNNHFPAQGVGWFDIPVANYVVGTNLIRRAYNGKYQISDFEFTFTAPSDAIAQITQIEMHLDRPGTDTELPMVDKYRPNALYDSLLWKNGAGETKATITRDGAASFSGPVSAEGSPLVKTNDSRLSDARTPSGWAGGHLGGSYPNPQVVKVGYTDSRAVGTVPNDYNGVAQWSFKQTGAVGLPGGRTDTYAFVYGFRAYADNSGGDAREYAYMGYGGGPVYRRTGATTTWGPWVKVEDGTQPPVFEGDPRLTDARPPTAHGHALTDANITGVLPDAQLPARLRPTGSSGVSDWNNAVEAGWYHGSAGANAPASGWLLGIVSTHDNSPGNRYVTQKVWQFTDVSANDSKCWERRSTAASVWTPWRRVRYLEGELDARYVTQTRSSGAGYDTIITRDEVLRISQSSEPIVGSLYIFTKIPYGATMTQIRVHGYNYRNARAAVDVTVGLYAYNAGDPNPLSSSVRDNGDLEVSVNVGRDGAGNVVLALSPQDNEWRYPKLIVDALLGYQPHPLTLDGWTYVFSATPPAGYSFLSTPSLSRAARTDDPRFTNARPPTAHNHPVTELSAGGTRSASTFLRGDGTWATPADTNTTYAPQSQAEAESSTDTNARLTTGQRLYQAIAKHARLSTWVPSWNDVTGKPATFPPSTHGHALTDDNITGVLPIGQAPTPSSGAASADQLVRGNDPRLTDARPPAAHSHPVTELSAGGTRSASTYLRGDGTWATPPTSSSVVNGRQFLTIMPRVALFGVGMEDTAYLTSQGIFAGSHLAHVTFTCVAAGSGRVAGYWKLYVNDHNGNMYVAAQQRWDNPENNVYAHSMGANLSAIVDVRGHLAAGRPLSLAVNASVDGGGAGVLVSILPGSFNIHFTGI